MTPKTILLVDDDPDIHVLFRAHLEEAGYRTASAYDGVSSLRLAQRDIPDLVILDLGLPAGDGETTLRSLRSFQQLASVPVLVVSGRDKASWGERLEAFGATGYIEKPVDPKRLVARVDELLGNSAPPALSHSDAAAGSGSTPIPCPHCGGEVGTLSSATTEVILARLSMRA